MVGPIDAVLYQPVQPRVGEGAAQVVSAPNTERAVAFMRAETAQIRAEQRQQARKEREDLLKAIDTSLAASQGLNVYDRDARIYADKMKELYDYTAEKVPEFEKGGAAAAAARIEVQRKAAELQMFAQNSQQQMKRAKLIADAIRENPDMYSPESIQEFRTLTETEGGVFHDWMSIPDNPINIDDSIDKAWNAMGSQAEGFFKKPVTTTVGQAQETRWSLDEDAYEQWVRTWVEGDLRRRSAFETPFKKQIASGEMSRDEAIEKGIQRQVQRRREAAIRHMKALTQTGSGSSRVTPDEMRVAEGVKRDVNEAVVLGDISAIRKHIKGSGVNVELEYEAPDGAVVKQLPRGQSAGFGPNDYKPLAVFFISKTSETKEGKTTKTTKTRDKIDVIPLRPGDENALYSKIAQINPDVKMSAIQLDEAPQGNRQEIDRLRREGHFSGRPPQVNQVNIEELRQKYNY